MLHTAHICGTCVSTDTNIVHIFNIMLRKWESKNVKSAKILNLLNFSIAKIKVSTVRVAGEDKEDWRGRLH